MKEVGILAPLFTLPNKFGIGDFSLDTNKFINIVKSFGFKYWQILPLNPVGNGNSPYQSISSFALDDIYVSLVDLKKRKLIDKYKEYGNKETAIDYEKVRKYKLFYFKIAFDNFIKSKDYKLILNKFINKNKWVDEYASYIVLNRLNKNKKWYKWKILNINDKDNNLDYEYEIFKQYILDEEWKSIHEYADKIGIKIIGDLPFYVGYDSSDCYFNKDSFILNKDNSPKLVAGVPPDYFSSDGQMWGNPIYNWDYLSKNKYKLIVDRILRSMEIYDLVRLDHFRAFDTYYTIDALATSAKVGEWIEAPGYDFFDYLLNNYKNIKIIAEDLGNMRDEVYTLRDHYKFPGMEVVQFTIIDEEINHHVMPSIYKRENAIFYSGTHDNDTLLHWYQSMSSFDRNNIMNFLNSKGYLNGDFIHKIFNYILDEPANKVVFSILDILRVNEFRFNEPGTLSNKNWSYRINDYKDLLVYKTEISNLIKKYNK